MQRPLFVVGSASLATGLPPVSGHASDGRSAPALWPVHPGPVEAHRSLPGTSGGSPPRRPGSVQVPLLCSCLVSAGRARRGQSSGSCWLFASASALRLGGSSPRRRVSASAVAAEMRWPGCVVMDLASLGFGRCGTVTSVACIRMPFGCAVTRNGHFGGLHSGSRRVCGNTGRLPEAVPSAGRSISARRKWA